MTAPFFRQAWVAPAAIALTLLAAAVVGVATLTPAPSGPAQIPYLDKAMHFLGFFGIVLPVAVAFPRHVWIAVVLAAVYGGAIELIQPSVGRGAEWGDFAANVAGAATAAVLGRALARRFAGWISKPRGDR